MPQLEISSFSSQIFWLVLSFFMLLLVSYKAIIPAMDDIFKNRSCYLDSILDQALGISNQAKAVEEHVSESLEKARKEITIAEEKAVTEFHEKVLITKNELINMNTEKGLLIVNEMELEIDSARKELESSVHEFVSLAYKKMYSG